MVNILDASSFEMKLTSFFFFQCKDRNENVECNKNMKIFTDDIFITDITSGFVTVTIKECTSAEGFFKNRLNTME